jgi:hypothetical protein
MAANSGAVKAGPWQPKGGGFAHRLLRLDFQALDYIDHREPFLTSTV